MPRKRPTRPKVALSRRRTNDMQKLPYNRRPVEALKKRIGDDVALILEALGIEHTGPHGEGVPHYVGVHEIFRTAYYCIRCPWVRHRHGRLGAVVFPTSARGIGVHCEDCPGSTRLSHAPGRGGDVLDLVAFAHRLTCCEDFVAVLDYAEALAERLEIERVA
jgi:hypothetical protein